MQIIDVTPKQHRGRAFDALKTVGPRLPIQRCHYFNSPTKKFTRIEFERALEDFDYSTLRSNDCIFLDRSGESSFPDLEALVNFIKNVVAKTEVPPNHVFLCSQVDVLPPRIENLGVSWIEFHGWPVLVALRHREYPDELSDWNFNALQTSEFKFLSINRKAHAHRKIACSYIQSCELKQAALLSFGQMPSQTYERAAKKKELTETYPNLHRYLTTELTVEEVPCFLKQQRNATRKTKTDGLTGLPENAVEISHLYVPTETDFSDSFTRLTEKTYKGFAYFRPMVLLSGPRSLVALRNDGFETFSDFIDETYDDLTAPEARLTAVLSELHRLKDVLADPTERARFCDSMRPVCQHNQQVLVGKFINQSLHRFEKAMRNVFSGEKHPVQTSEAS